MKRILCMILALTMFAAILTGCGPASDPTPSDQNNTSKDVKITDAYTYTDPADLEFDTRYVLYYGSDNPTIQQSASSGMLNYYQIIYAKDEQAISAYTVYAFKSADEAKAYADSMVAMGVTLTQAEADGSVIYSVSDAQTMEMLANSLKDSGVMTDTKAESLVNFYIGMTGAELKE